MRYLLRALSLFIVITVLYGSFNLYNAIVHRPTCISMMAPEDFTLADILGMVAISFVIPLVLILIRFLIKRASGD